MSLSLCPFPKEHQLNHELDFLVRDDADSNSNPTMLPGQPCISLTDTSRLYEFLGRDLCAPDLERMAPYLWTMSTQSSANISPLHHQKVKGREIVVSEDPRLHLVWIHRFIFIKPLPRYLLSEPFWKKYLTGGRSMLSDRELAIQRAARGYLRTYYYLIRYESDFHLARDERLRLIPADVTWAQVSRFTSMFLDISNSDVSARYAYGELRLTRLNFYAKIFLRQWYFEQIYGQYDAYFSRFYGPLLFVFGMLSVMLSSLQVEMAVEQVISAEEHRWKGFWWFCRWFSIFVVIVIFAMGFGILLVLGAMISNEWIFALKERHQKRRMGKNDV